MGWHWVVPLHRHLMALAWVPFPPNTAGLVPRTPHICAVMCGSARNAEEERVPRRPDEEPVPSSQTGGRSGLLCGVHNLYHCP